METQIYKVRDPQGAMREIRGPVGASDEDVIKEAKRLFAEPKAPVEPVTPPGQIPKAGPYVAPPAETTRAPSYLTKAAEYAAAVPAGGLLAGGLRAAAAGTRLAPYAATAAEALIPKTLGGLTAATGLGALSAFPAEFARRQAEKRGAGTLGQTAAEMAGAATTALPGMAAGRAASALGGRIRQAFGGEAKELGERLATQARQKAAETIETAREAQAKPLSELTAIGRAETQLAGRLPKATERQQAREAKVESALNTISPQQNVLAEDVGAVIQPLGQANVKKLTGARTEEAITKIKDPGFAAAREREAAGQFIATDPKSAGQFNEVISEVERQIERTPEPFRSTLKKRFESIRGTERQMTDAESRVEQLRASIENRPAMTTVREPMTLDQAEFLRRMLKDRSITEVEGFPALDVSRMNTLAGKLTEAMKAFEPRTGEYLTKYRELSAPIEKALAGRGAALTEAELLAEQQAIYSADKTAATRYYLDGTQERAERLLELVGGKNPRLMNSIKGYFRTQLQNMSSKEAQTFVSKNKGLLRVFPELKDSLRSVVDAKRVAETASGAAKEKATAAAQRLTAARKTPEQAVKQSAELQRKYEGFQSNLLNAPAGKETQVAESFADAMYKDKLIDKVEYNNLLEQIRNVQKAAATQAEARQKLKTLFVRLGWGFGGVSAAGAAGFIF